MPYFFLKASAMAFEGPVDAELYRLTAPSFFAASITLGSLAAQAPAAPQQGRCAGQAGAHRE